MKRTTLVASALATSILLTACGGDDHGAGHGGEANSPIADEARRIEVTAEITGFEPAEITASDGEDLAVVLTSTDMLHDFVIDELDAHVAADRGETAEGGFRAEAGTYTYYCSVPGHRRAGMEGTLTVTGS
jgi:plastocyanin